MRMATYVCMFWPRRRRRHMYTHTTPLIHINLIKNEEGKINKLQFIEKLEKYFKFPIFTAPLFSLCS